jgi:hypothetical protein
MSELELIVTEHIPVEPARVWAYVATGYFEHHARWDPAITGMRRLGEGPLGPGTRGVETRRFIASQDAEFEVTVYQPEQRFGFRNLSGPFELEREYELSGTAESTTLRFRFRMAPKGPMRLLFPLLRTTIERQVRANIARIPSLVVNG